MRKLLLGLSLTSLLLLTACGGESSSETASGEKVEAPKTIIFNISSEPKSIDPQLNSATDGGIVVNNTFEGLMRIDDHGLPIPATAASYDLSEDGLTYTFHIREEAKWSDGEPVKAKDFEYAWKRALDPAVASEYAFQLFYIENGQKYFNGEADSSSVGIKALDDKTLEVKLLAPTPYFLALTTFYTLMPVREDIVAKKPEGWAKDPSIVVSNGPFVVSDYNPGDRIIVEKNPNYWNVANVDTDKVEFIEILDQSTALTAYNNGEVDVLISVPTQDIPKLQLEDPTFSIEPYLGVYYYVFNVDKEPTDNLDVRKALTYAIDRTKIVEQVTKAGQVPATGFVPLGLSDSQGNDFREHAGDFGVSPTVDLAKAKEHLAKAGYPNGEGFPELTLVYNTSENHKVIAEAIQAMWKKNLGIDVKLVNQEWAVFQDTRHVGNFEIARAGWIGDYGDPMTFLDLWTSYSGNNDAQWKWTTDPVKFADNKKFDDHIEASKLATGIERDEHLYAAEKLVMDQMISLPIYYYTGQVMIKEHLKGWERDILGTWYLGNVKFEY